MFYDGTNANDIFIGSAQDDLIYGNGGSDFFHGLSGNDYIYGGNGGTDFLFGGSGNDRIFSSFGGDSYMYGGTGDDYLEVWTDNTFTKINGGKGNDEAHIVFNWDDHFDIIATRNKTVVTHETGTIVIKNVEGIFFEQK